MNKIKKILIIISILIITGGIFIFAANYEIIDGLDSDKFTIDSSAGYLTINKNYPISNNSYEVNIINIGDSKKITVNTILATSCKVILDAGGSTGDGIYRIDPDGVGNNNPFYVYCDMVTDGGGWTLISNSSVSNQSYSLLTSNALNTSINFDIYDSMNSSVTTSDKMVKVYGNTYFTHSFSLTDINSWDYLRRNHQETRGDYRWYLTYFLPYNLINFNIGSKCNTNTLGAIMADGTYSDHSNYKIGSLFWQVGCNSGHNRREGGHWQVWTK